jgi:hypothetical protein
VNSLWTNGPQLLTVHQVAQSNRWRAVVSYVTNQFQVASTASFQTSRYP